MDMLRAFPTGKTLVTLALAGSVLALAPKAQATEWSDTWLGYRYGADYREPFNPSHINKNILSLTHASGYKYGANFFNVDMLRSNNEDLASGGGGGAQEVYVVYRTTLSGTRVFGTPLKYWGVIRDIGLTAGFDFSSKDDQFSARVYKGAIGPKVSFDVPGFLDIAVVLRTETNHNWFATGPEFGGAGCGSLPSDQCTPNVKFRNTWAIEASGLYPFNAGPVPAKVTGFLNYIGQKGKDGVGTPTHPELLTEVAVMFDVGSLAGYKDTVFAGVGYQYWHNKFGNSASDDPTGGSKASVAQFELEWHF